MSKNEELGLDLTEGKVFPKLVRYTIPFLIASILQTLYSTVDLSIVGRIVGTNGSVGVSMGGKVTNMVTMAGIALASAGQVYIGQLFGAKKRKELGESIGSLVSILFLVSVIMAVVIILALNWLMDVLNVPQEALSETHIYILISAIGFPFIFLYNAVCSILRGMGDSQSPLIFIAIASGINLILDFVLVGALGMGSGGAALATVVSQGLSFVFSVYYLYRKRENLSFDFHLTMLRIQQVHAKVIMKLGIPWMARQLLISISQLFVSSFVNAFGLAEAAAYGIGERIYQMLNTVDQSFNSAGAGMISQNLGAKKMDRVKEVVRSIIFLGIVFAVVVGALVIGFDKQVFGLFTTDPEVLAFSRPFSYIIAVTALLSGFNGAFMGVLNGAGKGGLSLLGGVLDSVVFRFIFCYIFAYAMDMGVVGFYMGSNFARIAPVMIGAIYYLSGNWKKKILMDSASLDESP